jgi:hypothetical protein
MSKALTAFLVATLSVAGLLAGQAPLNERLVITEKSGAYELGVPASRLSLKIPKGGFLPSKAAGEGSSSPRYFLLEDLGHSRIISGWFEPDAAFKGMDAFWTGEQTTVTQKGIHIQNVTRERIGNWQVVLYHIALSSGRSTNMRAEWVQAGTWIDLHLSVTANQSEAEGEKILRDVLNTIQVSEQKTTLAAEYMNEGSVLYLRNDFKNAIGPYSKALELEKTQPTLDKTLWHVLVDNLGMSYGITGDLKKAKETFEYGLTKDDAYPLFYYNLACTYAEMNDLENAIKQLKRAFEYRRNMLPGETMPDPSKDDSFQRFMRSPQFLAVLNEIK